MDKKKIILAAILALAAVLRVAGLDRVPPELFGDELDVGYHAYSLLKTGRDYYGQFLPTYIHSFSEWRAPLLMYVTTPFVGVFGLNEYGVRLPSAILGVLSIFLLYLLVKKTLRSERVALLAAFILAVSPWHLQYSRAAFEASLFLTLLLSGALLFLAGLSKNRWFYASAACFALTFYTYNTSNIFTPGLLLLLVLVNKNKLKTLAPKNLFGPATLFVLLSLPLVYHVFFGFAAERYGKFSLFTDTGIVDEINRKRTAGGDTYVEKILHNRPIGWGRRIAETYATAFSPQFLFMDGDITLRHSIQEVGELYWIQLPLLLFGAFWLLRKKDRKWAMFWFAWLLLAPIPASLTVDGARHATRLILMLPALTVITAVGAEALLRKRRLRKLTLVLVALIFLGEFTLYLHRYWVHYPQESWRWWQIGYKEAMTYMKENEENYRIVAFNNTYEPTLLRFLFWWEYPPSKFQDEFRGDKLKDDPFPNFNGFGLEERYFFGLPDHEIGGAPGFVTPDIIYLASHEHEAGGDWDWEKSPPPGVRVLKTARNLYGQPVLYVITGNETP